MASSPGSCAPIRASSTWKRPTPRFLTPEDFPELMDWMTTDVAFISLTKILPAAYSILKENGSGVALIKPQF